MQWSNQPHFNSMKQLQWKILVEKGNSGKFCQNAGFCSTPRITSDQVGVFWIIKALFSGKTPKGGILKIWNSLIRIFLVLLMWGEGVLPNPKFLIRRMVLFSNILSHPIQNFIYLGHPNLCKGGSHKFTKNFRFSGLCLQSVWTM